MEKRFYYKAKSGHGLMNLKSPLSKEALKDYDAITAEEFEALQASPKKAASKTKAKAKSTKKKA